MTHSRPNATSSGWSSNHSSTPPSTSQVLSGHPHDSRPYTDGLKVSVEKDLNRGSRPKSENPGSEDVVREGPRCRLGLVTPPETEPRQVIHSSLPQQGYGLGYPQPSLVSPSGSTRREPNPRRDSETPGPEGSR